MSRIVKPLSRASGSKDRPLRARCKGTGWTGARRGGKRSRPTSLFRRPVLTAIAKILLLGSGELGREFVISAKRLGAHVVACDSYADAPAMQLADEAEVFSMLD